MRALLERSPAVHRVQQLEHRLDGTVEQFKAIVLQLDARRFNAPPSYPPLCDQAQEIEERLS